MPSKKIEVQGLQIRIEPINDRDYVSLTDIAKKSSEAKPAYTIQNWIRNTNTIRFLYTWEKIYNSNIKVVQLHDLLERATNNRRTMSPKKWIELTDSIGLIAKPSRGGGTFAHKDIALNFCYWLSPEFQVYMIKAFQDLIEQDFKKKYLEWHVTKITDNIEEVRNLLDSIPGQDPQRNRLKSPKEKE